MRTLLVSAGRLTLFLAFTCLFGEQICSAQNVAAGQEALTKAENNDNDPAAVRAWELLKKKLPEEVEQYERLEAEFTKNLTWKEQVAFGQWRAGGRYAAWEKEWKERPESHIAFALYIRDEVKKINTCVQLKN